MTLVSWNCPPIKEGIPVLACTFLSVFSMISFKHRPFGLGR